MRKRIFAVALAASLVGGVALAQQATESRGSLEARLERIEQAIARLDRKLSARADNGMMEGCREMMGGGMMSGGMMGGGMMGGGEGRGSRSPNEQWREAPAR